jgi:hypothetical protein
MLDAFLVAEKTTVAAKGDGPTLELKEAAGRVFLLTLAITNHIEQESITVGVHGSADGVTWDPHELASFPQKFYRGEAPLLLDLSRQPDVKFIRAHWEVGRWGHNSEPPMFEFHVTMREIPLEILAEAAGRSRTQ